jgi:hypothetical protein
VDNVPTLRLYVRQSGPPWVRAGARFFDSLLFVWLFELIYAAGHLQFAMEATVLRRILPAVLSIPSEAILVSAFAFTPGKWFFSITVLRKDGSRLTVSESFSRAIWVFFAGQGARLFTPLTAAWSLWRIANKVEAFWDQECGTMVVWHRNHTRVAAGVTLMFALFYLLTAGAITPSILPPGLLA